MDAYRDLDPGYLKLVLTAKTLVATGLAMSLAIVFARLIPDLTLPGDLAQVEWFSNWFEAAKSAPDLTHALATVAAITTLNAFILHPSANYRSELRWFRLIAITSFCLVSAVGLAGPGSWGYGDRPVAILWVFLIAIGIYVRGWGPNTAKFGILTALFGVIFVITNPTFEAGFWFPIAALIALVTTFVVRFLTIRVSVIDAFHAEERWFLEVLADQLRTLRADAGPIDEAAAADQVRRRWLTYQAFFSVASNERPRITTRLRARIAVCYRMMITQRGITEAANALTPSARTSLSADPRVGSTIDALTEGLEDASPIAFPSERMTITALDDLLVDRNHLTGHPEDAAAIRFVDGLKRLEGLLNQLRENRSDTDLTLVPALLDSPETGAREARRLAARLALQGFVAASITTALQFVFELDHAYWATMTVALVLNGKVGHTTLRSIQRALGTAAGVILALVCAPFFGTSVPVFLVLALLCLPALFAFIETRYAVTSAILGFLVAMSIHVFADAGPLELASRAYETAIGAAVALVASWVILPTFGARTVRKELTRFFDSCQYAIQQIDDPDQSGLLSDSLLRGLQTLRADSPALKAELRILGHDESVVDEVFIMLDALVSYIAQFETSRPNATVDPLPEKANEAFGDLTQRLCDALRVLAERVAQPDVHVAGVTEPFEEKRLGIRDFWPEASTAPGPLLLKLTEHGTAGMRIGRTLNEIDKLIARIQSRLP